MQTGPKGREIGQGRGAEEGTKPRMASIGVGLQQAGGI